MSHAVRIDYQGISIKCQSICEMASEQLCKMNKILCQLEAGSQRLLNSQTEALKKEIVRLKEQLEGKIERVVNQAKNNAGRGTVVVDSDFMGKHANAYDVIDEAEELKRMVSFVVEDKLTEMESLLNQLLRGELSEHQEKLKDIAMGRIVLDQKFVKNIANISDEVTKQYVYIAWVKNPGMSFDELMAVALKIKEESITKEYERIEEIRFSEIKDELSKEKVDEKTISKILSVEGKTAKERVCKARELANTEIVDEKVRKGSVKIIVQAIKKRGFIVDSKTIKLDRENNQVIIIGQKPSGAKAEFKVFLDGKFEYKFDGYEGQACQKDIQPFISDLEEVYGIKITNQTEIWKNPDKLSTQKYQAQAYKENGGGQ